MKTIVATLTVRFPLAVLLAEGETEESVREQFEGLKREMTETAPDGVEFSLNVTTEGE